MINCKLARSKSFIIQYSRIGADFTINYKKTPEYSKVIQEITGGKGVDIILDPVGA
jgi:NADPH:quinone reductase-like Zn-dependent oxidoreductase